MAREIPIKISVDGREAQRGINRVDSSMETLKRQTDRTDKSTTSLRRNMDRLGRAGKGVASSLVSLKGAIGALGLLAAAEGFRRLTTSVVAAGNSIDKAAQTAGTTTAQLQELRFGLGQLTNLTDRDVDSGLRRFNRRLGLAREGSGALNEELKNLNITAGQDTPEALESALSTLGDIESGSERAALASRAFGEDAGPKLAAALSEGTEALREQRDVAEELGIVLSEDAIENAAKLQDEFTLLGQIIQRNFQAGFLENFQGEFDTFRAAISDDQFIQSIREFGDFAGDALEFIVNNSDDIASGFRNTASAISSLSSAINDLVDFIGPLAKFNNLLLELTGIPAIGRFLSGGSSSGGPREGTVFRLDPIVVEATNEALEDSAGTVRTLSEEFELLGRSIPNLEVREVGEGLEESLQDRLEELDVQREARRVGERIGDSLSDALITGDFEGVGDAIGAAIGSSVGESVAENVTNALSRSLGNTAGGIVGGAVGGVVGGLAGQIASDLVGDIFGSDFVDPTARRQAEQGTGTVLGSIDAKSESISNSVEEISEASNEIVNINSGMLRSLEQVQNGIQQAAARVAQGRGDVNFRAPDALSNSQQATRGLLPALGITEALPGGAALFNTLDIGTDFVDDIVGGLVGKIDDVLGGALSSVGNALFGGDREVVDEGIDILRGNIQKLTQGTVARAFATIEESGGLFGSDDVSDRFQALAEETNNQFNAVFRDIVQSVEQGAEEIGVRAGAIQKRLKFFVAEFERISLEGLDAGEKRDEINAVFSSIFDDLTSDVVPFLEDFQRAGEGLGETLARVSTQVGVLEEAAITLNSTIDGLSGRGRAQAATDLSRQLGGTEEFARALSGLEDNFLSTSEQFEANQRRLSEALGNLPLPETRQGFVKLARSQDLSTESGRENLATILRVRDSADEFFDSLEDRQKEQTDALKQGTNDALSALQESVNAELESIRNRRQSLQDGLSDATSETDTILSDIRSITQVRREESREQLANEREAIQARADARQDAIDNAKLQTDNIIGDIRSITQTRREESQRQLASEREAIQARADARREAIQDAESETDNILGDIKNITSARKEALNNELEQEKEAIKSRADARQEAIAESISAEQERLSRFESLFDTASSALDRLMPEIVDDSISFERAMERVRNAIQSGGIGAAEDLQRISEVDASRFASRFEFERTQGRAAATLSEAQEEAGGRVSNIERQIEALENQKQAVDRSADRQIDQAQESTRKEIERLDGILEDTKQQIDEARGAREGITDLDTALDAVDEAIKQGNQSREKDDKINTDELIAKAESRHQDEISRLDGILEDAQKQIDQARGAREGITNLDKALGALDASVTEESKARQKDENVNTEKLIAKAEERHNQEISRLDGILEDAKTQIDEARGAREKLTSLDTALGSLSSLIDQENSIRRQIEESNFEKRTENLNQILTNANEQLNELRGINNSVIGVQEALGDFEFSLNNERNLNNERSGPDTGSSPGSGDSGDQNGNDGGGGGQQTIPAWENYLNSNVDVFRAFNGDIPNGAAFDMGDLRDAAGDALNSAESFAKWHYNNFGKEEGREGFEKVPAMAEGGTFGGGLRLVGEQGPEIEATGPSRIMNNTDLMQSLGASKEMLEELKALRKEMRAIGSQQTEQAKKTAKLLRKFDIDGLPDTRTA